MVSAKLFAGMYNSLRTFGAGEGAERNEVRCSIVDSNLRRLKESDSGSRKGNERIIQVRTQDVGVSIQLLLPVLILC